MISNSYFKQVNKKPPNNYVKYNKTPKIILKSKKSKNKILGTFLTPNEINQKSRNFVTSYNSYKKNLDKPIIKLFLLEPYVQANVQLLVYVHFAISCMAIISKNKNEKSLTKNEICVKSYTDSIL